MLPGASWLCETVIGTQPLSNQQLSLAVADCQLMALDLRERASHLPRLKDLDGLDTRFLAPAMGLAFGQRTASHPFGVAAGRDALGPEVARRVRGEMDHETVRINMARATALVHLATGIGDLELDAHDYSVMK